MHGSGGGVRTVFCQGRQAASEGADLPSSAYTEAGLSIIAYGASSKGQSLLNMLRLDRELVTCVRDDSIGDDIRWIPGAALPVVPGRDARVRNADVVLLTATTHIPELIARHERDSARRPTFLATSAGLAHRTDEHAPAIGRAFSSVLHSTHRMTERRIRLVFVTSQFSQGGAERYLFETCRALDRKRFDIDILTCQDVDRAVFITQQLRGIGVPDP